MKKFLLFLTLAGFLSISHNLNSTEINDTFTEIGKKRNIRVSGTISPYNSSCYIFFDTCSGVNYILEGDASAYVGSGSFCAILKFVPPERCGVSGEARIMNIRPGKCRGGGTFCR